MPEYTRFAVVALAGLLVLSPLQAQVGRTEGMLDPNLASEQQLTGLPHFTPVLAKELIDGRPWLSMTALDARLAGSLTAEQRTEVYRRMFLHLNLNSASREEILLIPGVGNRMLREFLEYRPYRALAVFTREMGKYVDDAEVNRLAGYVYVPVDLNTASDQDILSIPGIGSRMLREFKEYRPYDGIERFRREIGKYVDKGEVARLERYLTIGG